MAKPTKKKAATKVVAAKKTTKTSKAKAPKKKEVEEEEEELTDEELNAKEDAEKKAGKGKRQDGPTIPAKKAVKVKAGSANPEKTYQQIKDLIECIDGDIDKFLVNETRAAGRRVRGYAQSIRKLCAVFRKEIQAVNNERKG